LLEVILEGKPSKKSDYLSYSASLALWKSHDIIISSGQ
jgi:hypothetical protein